jgi:hypothetical protein
MRHSGMLVHQTELNIGLSLIICGDIKDAECQYSLSPHYYTFTHGYGLNKNSSVLTQVGRYFGLNLSPLGRYIAMDAFADQETNLKYIRKGWLDIDLTLPLVIHLMSSMVKDRTFVDALEFRGAEKAQEYAIREYLLGRQIIVDLTNLSEAIECYKRKGASKVFIGLHA